MQTIRNVLDNNHQQSGYTTNKSTNNNNNNNYNNNLHYKHGKWRESTLDKSNLPSDVRNGFATRVLYPFKNHLMIIGGDGGYH